MTDFSKSYIIYAQRKISLYIGHNNSIKS